MALCRATILTGTVTALCIICIIISWYSVHTPSHPTNWPQAPRIAVLMVAVNFAPAKVTAPVWQAYADRHGYEFVMMDDAAYDDTTFGIAWWRVRLVRDMLASGKYDAVMHVDADTVPVRPDISVEEWMRSHGGEDTSVWLSGDLGTRDHIGSINFGVFVMKPDTFCLNLLESMWSERHARTTWPREQGCIEDKLEHIFTTRRDMFDKHVHISKYGEMQHFLPEQAMGGDSWVYHAAGRKEDEILSTMAAVMPTVRRRMSA